MKVLGLDPYGVRLVIRGGASARARYSYPDGAEWA